MSPGIIMIVVAFWVLFALAMWARSDNRKRRQENVRNRSKTVGPKSGTTSLPYPIRHGANVIPHHTHQFVEGNDVSATSGEGFVLHAHEMQGENPGETASTFGHYHKYN